VNIPPRGLISSLGAKGEVENGPLRAIFNSPLGLNQTPGVKILCSPLLSSRGKIVFIPGTNVMILKIFLPKNSAKKLAVLSQNKAKF
jgi:hypothetical protein